MQLTIFWRDKPVCSQYYMAYAALLFWLTVSSLLADYGRQSKPWREKLDIEPF